MTTWPQDRGRVGAVTSNSIDGQVRGAVVQAGQIATVNLLPVPEQRFVPRELPAPPRGFVDRTDALDVLAALLLPPPDVTAAGPGVAVLMGAAGVGKSALARYWAARHADRFPAGQVYIDLTATGTTSAAILDALTQRLINFGVSAAALPSGLPALSALWRSVTHDQPVLMVIDGADASADLGPLLPASPTSAVLITTRVGLPRLIADGAYPYWVSLLPDDAAFDLLAAVARDHTDDTRGLAEIARACGGHASTLTLTGAYLALNPDRPMGTVLAELTSTHPMTGNRATSWERLMRATHDDLPSASRTLFERLCAMPIAEHAASLAFTIEEAAVLAELVPGADDDTVTARLDVLVQHHLLDVRPGDPAPYLIAPAARAHQRERLDDTVFDTMASLLGPYYLSMTASFVEATEPGKKRFTGLDTATLARFADRATAFAWLRTMRTNLVAFHGYSAERQWDEQFTIPLADVLWPALRQSGHHEEHLTVQMNAVHAAQRVGHGYLPVAWARAGWAQIALQRWQDAVDSCTNGLAVVEMCDEVEYARAATVSTRSTGYFHLSQFDHALADINTAIECDRRRGSPGWVFGLRYRRRAEILLALTLSISALRDIDDAILLTAADLRRPTELARAHQARGTIMIALDDLIEARRSYTAALEVLAENHHPVHEAETHQDMARTYDLDGDRQQAEAHYRAAAAAYTTAGHADRAAAATNMIAPQRNEP